MPRSGGSGAERSGVEDNSARTLHTVGRVKHLIAMASASRRQRSGRANWARSNAARKLRHAVIVASRAWGAAAHAPAWPIERRMSAYTRVDRVVVRDWAAARRALAQLNQQPALLVLVPTHGASTRSPTRRDVLLFGDGPTATRTTTVLARALLVSTHVHVQTCFAGLTLGTALREAAAAARFTDAMARRWTDGQHFVVTAFAKSISAAAASGPHDYLAHGCVVRGHASCCAPAGLVVIARATWVRGALRVREVKTLNGRAA